MDSSCLTWSIRWAISWINISRVAGVWTWSILSDIWILLDLLSYKVISLFANACVKSLDIKWMLWTSWAFSVYSNESFLAEAAAFIKIFIEITNWWDKRLTRESSSIIYFSIFTSGASFIYYIISNYTNTCLLLWRIYLIYATIYFYASVID